MFVDDHILDVSDLAKFSDDLFLDQESASGYNPVSGVILENIDVIVMAEFPEPALEVVEGDGADEGELGQEVEVALVVVLGAQFPESQLFHLRYQIRYELIFWSQSKYCAFRAALPHHHWHALAPPDRQLHLAHHCPVVAPQAWAHPVTQLPHVLALLQEDSVSPTGHSAGDVCLILEGHLIGRREVHLALEVALPLEDIEESMSFVVREQLGEHLVLEGLGCILQGEVHPEVEVSHHHSEVDLAGHLLDYALHLLHPCIVCLLSVLEVNVNNRQSLIADAKYYLDATFVARAAVAPHLLAHCRHHSHFP